jgi:hypothetical protein
MGLITILGLIPQQLWRAQFVRSSWDPAAPRPYLVKAWWRPGEAHDWIASLRSR